MLELSSTAGKDLECPSRYGWPLEWSPNGLKPQAQVLINLYSSPSEGIQLAFSRKEVCRENRGDHSARPQLPRYLRRKLDHTQAQPN